MTFLPQGWIIQQWQYGGSTAAEKNIDEAIALALEYKAAGIAEKAMDGLTWMGHIAVGSPAHLGDITDHRDRCQAAGIEYLPWVNPLHGSRNFLTQEARTYADIGNRCGCMVWDSEPYDQFWGAHRPAGDAAYLMETFRQHAPGCFNVWQPDPRPGRLIELRPGEWAPSMNVYSPQCYWTDFGTTPESEITRAHTQAQSMGIGECAPTIPANGDPAAIPVALNLMGELGMTSTIAWRLGTLDDAHMSWLRDLAGAGGEPPPPPPPPPPPDWQAKYETLKSGLQALLESA